MRPKDAVDGLSGEFWAAMTWLYLGHAPCIKKLPLSNFTPKQIELESRGWSQFFANCLLFLKNTKVLNFSLFLHKKIDAFKDNIINAKVSLNHHFRQFEWAWFALFSALRKTFLHRVLQKKMYFLKPLKCRKKSAIWVPIISALMTPLGRFAIVDSLLKPDF